MTNEWTVACKEFNIGVGRIDTILAQRTLSLEIRGFEDSDYRRLAEIYDAIFPERARSVEEWRFYDDILDNTNYRFRAKARIQRKDARLGINYRPISGKHFRVPKIFE